MSASRFVLMPLVALLLSMLMASSVAAEDPDPQPSVGLQGVHQQTAVDGQTAISGQPEGAATPAGETAVVYEPACVSNTPEGCKDYQTCVNDDGEPSVVITVSVGGEYAGQYCEGDVAAAPPQVTPGLVQRAFRRLDWPRSALVIQPPDGRTLVNFETNLYTVNTEPSTRTVTLLAQEVTVEATPIRYTWRHGDGTAQTTTTPGAAYPDLEVTHDYLRTGTYSASVATTYAGRYRLGSGPWQTIPDTLTLSGPAEALTAVEARPKLVPAPE